MLLNGFSRSFPSETYTQTQAYKNDLLQNHNIISVTDFGAGSKVFTSNQRQVSKIAKVAGISTKKQRLLMQLMAQFQPKTILEFGTSLGLATSSMAFANKNAQITTLEGCPETAKVAQTLFDKYNLNTINLIVGDFKNTLDQATSDKTFDCIYFDGNHQKDATISYFEHCLKTAKNDSFFIFDDIHWSKEMEEAWNYIKAHKKVTVTVDVYWFGIVFFRSEEKKQDFILKV